MRSTNGRRFVPAAALFAMASAAACPCHAQGLSAPPRYRITDISAFGGAFVRPSAIAPSGEVVGTAAVVEIAEPQHLHIPARDRSASYFDNNAPFVDREMIDIIGLVYLAFNWQMVRDFYRGKRDGGEADDPRRTGWVPPVRQVNERPFLRRAERTRTLGTLGGESGAATAVNRRGEIVGTSQASPYEDLRRAFLYRPQAQGPGAMTDIGALGTGRSSAAYGVNDAEQVVGEADAGGGVLRAFLWEAGKMHDLGSLGGSQSYARAINNGGQVVGWAETTQYETRAFLWDSGVMRPLATLPDAKATYAVALNDAGTAVGRAETTEGKTHAVLWDARGRVATLGTLGGPSSEANALNSYGQIVGTSDVTGDAKRHAFLWQGHRLYDLNTLLPPGSGWTLVSATGINDRGEIAGWGLFRGKERAFLLTPELTPPPDTAPAR